jgi:hypothetical protein
MTPLEIDLVVDRLTSSPRPPSPPPGPPPKFTTQERFDRLYAQSIEKEKRLSAAARAQRERELAQNTGSVPKTNPRSQLLFKSKLQMWLTQVFATTPRAITPEAALQLLREVGILDKHQTLESVPIVNEKRKAWVIRQARLPERYNAAEIRSAIIEALAFHKPSKFDIFARPLILLAFSDRIQAHDCLNPRHRKITIFPHRFELFEPHLRRRLLDWRDEFHGKITFVPEGGHYTSVHKDVPMRIVQLCRQIRIHAALKKGDQYIVEADLRRLIPPKERKGRRSKSPPLMEEPRVVPPSRRASSAIRGDAVARMPFLNEDIALHFRDFPTQPVIAPGRRRRDAELVLVLDVQQYPMGAVGGYVADTLRWAVDYPFVTLHFVTGPVARSPILGDPQRRNEVVKTVESVRHEHGVEYGWEIPMQNHSLVVCKFKARSEEA